MSVFETTSGYNGASISANHKALENLRDYIVKSELDWTNVPHAARTAADLLIGAQTASGSSKDSDKDELRRSSAAMIRACTDSFQIVRCVVTYLEQTELFYKHADDAALIPLVNMRIAGLQYEIDMALVSHLPAAIESGIVSVSNLMSRQLILETVERVIFPAVAEVTSNDDNTKSALWRITDDAVAKIRIEGLFEDVIDKNLPEDLDQVTRLKDLKETMVTPKLRHQAVDTFNVSVESRLLNGGVDTVDIIEAYLACIRVFSYLDPQGVLLQKVAEPIRNYLRERSDTVDELAMGLFGVEDSRLSFLASRLDPKNVPNGEPAVNSMEESSKPNDVNSNAEEGLGWTPDPVDAPADFVREQTSDLVASLLSLYDNKEVFIKKLASLFSEKLLKLSSDDNLENLEVICGYLVSRFGEADMQKIRVMIHDFSRGRKDADDIHKKHTSLSWLNGFAISKMYWPHIREGSGEKLRLPSEVARNLSDYSEGYRDLPMHAPYELYWLYDKGFANVTIELQDRQVNIDATPEQATVIYAFQDVDNHGLDSATLSEATGLDGSRLLENIQFWINQGVLRLTNGRYCVIESEEDAPDSATGTQSVIDPTNMASNTNDEGIEEMRVYWSYIVGMLTNLGPLPVEKIHSFLVMFVPRDDPYVKTKAELENFLLAMVHDEKLHVVEESKFALV